jgi:hypothetical protein
MLPQLFSCCMPRSYAVLRDSAAFGKCRLKLGICARLPYLVPFDLDELVDFFVLSYILPRVTFALRLIWVVANEHLVAFRTRHRLAVCDTDSETFQDERKPLWSVAVAQIADASASEKGVRLAQKMQVGPCNPLETRL